MPSSATVGVSGSVGRRSALVIASNRSLPLCTCGITGSMPLNITSACPDTTSMIVCMPPRPVM